MKMKIKKMEIMKIMMINKLYNYLKYLIRILFCNINKNNIKLFN